LEELKNLLEPFAAHTDLLQTDALSLSYVLPSILDLDCHLQQFSSAKLLTSAMRADIQQRFTPILDPTSHNFNPLPAAACFLDPNVGHLLLTPHMRHLLDAVKLFVTAEVCDCTDRDMDIFGLSSSQFCSKIFKNIASHPSHLYPK